MVQTRVTTKIIALYSSQGSNGFQRKLDFYNI